MPNRRILYRVLMFGAAVVLYSAVGMVLAAFGVDKPSVPQAGLHSAEIGTAAPTAVGSPGIGDTRKIKGWDASELRGDDGEVVACMIRAHYTMGGVNGRSIATFLVASRSKGLSMLLKDSALDLPGGAGASINATLKFDGKPFTGFSAEVEGHDEIAILPEHGMALAAALDDGVQARFDALKVETLNFPVVAGVVPWLRTCTRRWGISFEPDAKG
ncbi:MAG TPA: hypothetical protein VMA30_01240 [Xanthobacteraceae bacterium]|nr:hypothetical protein [Xanthobacteraceae bacterium]